jgi:hypothetical protein
VVGRRDFLERELGEAAAATIPGGISLTVTTSHHHVLLRTWHSSHISKSTFKILFDNFLQCLVFLIFVGTHSLSIK